jgi:hypothetical protein
MSNNSLQTQLNNVLNDLESTYLDFFGGKLWAGVNASPTKSSFVASSTKDDEIKDAKALAALTKIPFDGWAKLHAVCHHCGEKGHIRPHCPKYIEQVKSRGLKPPSEAHPRAPPVAQPPGLPNPRCDYSKNQKAKAIWAAAFKAPFNNNCIDNLNGNNGNDSNKGNQDKDELPNNEADEDLCGFLSMVGYLKE